MSRIVSGLVGIALSLTPNFVLADSDDSTYNNNFDEAAFAEITNYAKDHGRILQRSCGKNGRYMLYSFNGLSEQISAHLRTDYEGLYIDRNKLRENCKGEEILRGFDILVTKNTVWVVDDAEFVISKTDIGVCKGENKGLLPKLSTLIKRTKVQPKLF